MNLSQLIEAARARLDDEVSSAYRYSTTQLTHFINEANSEAHRRTRFRIDNSMRVSVVAGTSMYYTPDGVIFLQRAKLTSEDTPLIFESYKTLDEYQAGWQTHTGTPTHILLDLSIEKFTLYPTPDLAGTLELVAIIEPEQITCETELPQRFGYGLIDWVCYRAYQMNDIDKNNIPLSKAYLDSFESEFGTRSSAKDEIFNARNRPFDNFDGNF